MSLSPGEHRALATQSSQRVVRNHLDTIAIVFENASEVAAILNVSPIQLACWPYQRLPDPGDRDHIRRFADVLSLLLQRYAPAVAAEWFHAPNIHMLDGGGTPVELIQAGRWDTLRTYAEEAVSEGFS